METMTEKTESQQVPITMLKFKKLIDTATAPKKGSPDAAGFDLVAVSKTIDPSTNCTIYGTGLAFEIPKGYVGLLFPRSSVYKKCHQLANSIGVIDSDYRGEVIAIFRNTKFGGSYQIGERVCQLVILPAPNFELEEVQKLSGTERGSGGFGSTGA